MNKLIALLPLTAALITACGGGGTPAANSTQPSAVAGTVAGYSAAATSLELREGTKAIASTSVSTSGGFTLPLPSAQTITPYLSSLGSDEFYNGAAGSQCSGTLSNSNPAAQAYAFATLWVGDTSYSTFQFSSNQAAYTASGSGYVWVYSTQATALSGTQTCTQANSDGGTDTLKVNFNAPIKVGWNVIREQADAAGSVTSHDVNTTLTLITVNDQATTWSSGAAQPLSLKNDTAAAGVLKRFLKLR